MPLSKILCIMGVTGTGKSSLALELSQKQNIAIINFDSRQVYRELPIITAQPNSAERKRCPHYLYGFLPAGKQMDAGMFISKARETIDAARQKGLLPVLVGGTGFYLRSLLYGLAPIPDVEPDVRRQVALQYAELGSRLMHKRLAGIDPEYAQKIHFNDKQRVCRAMEVYLSTGKTITSWHASQTENKYYDALKIGFCPDEWTFFKQRLLGRIESMLEMGAVNEVKQVLEQFGSDAPGLNVIGGAELVSYLLGRTSLKESKEMWLNNTRAYAKRQITWFKKESGVIWVDSSDFDSISVDLNDFLQTEH